MFFVVSCCLSPIQLISVLSPVAPLRAERLVTFYWLQADFLFACDDISYCLLQSACPQAAVLTSRSWRRRRRRTLRPPASMFCRTACVSLTDVVFLACASAYSFLRYACCCGSICDVPPWSCAVGATMSPLLARDDLLRERETAQ